MARGGSRSGPRRGGSSRGRGRGRGGMNRFGKRPKFDSSRVEEKKEESSEDESSQEQSPSENEEDASSGSGSDDEDEEEAPAAKPYTALLRSLAESAANKAKRRKLDHQDEKGHEPPSQEPDSQDLDLVQESEEAPETGLEEDDSDDEDEDSHDSTDPFTTHFADPDESDVSRRLRAVTKNEWTNRRVASKSTRTVLTVPKVGDGEDDVSLLPPTISGPSSLHLKPKLKESVVSQRPEFTDAEQALASPLFNYYDTLYCQRTVANGGDLRRLVCLHALNHVFRTRDRVVKNSAKLAREDAEDTELELRDQGFTRPKVLVLLPTRQSCAKMVDTIYSLAEVDQQENRKRFDEAYVDKEPFPGNKPADFKDLFEGNSDDMFRLGVKFTRKTIKYFAQFYNSDILFASPLGLRMAIGASSSSDVEDKKNKKKKQTQDSDFLSSIEMVVVDQADALLMQNWEHVEYIFEHLNQQPKDAHGCDFSRVRSWYLDGHSRHYRQTIMLSAFNTPELSELMRSHCTNWAGKVRVQPEYQGEITQLGGVKAKQTFSRFDAASIAAEPDARFTYFTRAIVPSLVKRGKENSRDNSNSNNNNSGGGTLIFIPSYMDFVRVRNYFATNPAVGSLSFGAISDHSGVKETSRARSHFLTGRHRVLLYTERAHHFWRHQIKGVRRVIMYGLPDNPIFYREVAGGCLGRSEADLTLEPGQGHVRVVFSRYDVMKLERVVGTQRVARMLHERGDTFDFV